MDKSTILAIMDCLSSSESSGDEETITRNTERVTDIIKSVCILHSFIRKKGVKYTPYKQVENIQDSIDGKKVLPIQDLVLRYRATANQVKNYLANYFLTPRASIPWQWNYCV
jgi:hypothetical protein